MTCEEKCIIRTDSEREIESGGVRELHSIIDPEDIYIYIYIYSFDIFKRNHSTACRGQGKIYWPQNHFSRPTPFFS